MATVRRYAVLTMALFAAPAFASDRVDFNHQVRPLLASKCFACHGPDDQHREGGLRLDRRENATAPLEDGKTAIIPGDPKASELIARVTNPSDEDRMPPAGRDERLNPQEVDVLRRWIEQGAEFAPHWSFVPPRRADLPSVPLAWADSAVDAFMLERMVEAGLAPSMQAGRFDLARRLSLDLRGLPCSIDESRDFAIDPSPDAHERLVDRFLASPAFGERWARVWLDLARYADSSGYASDPLRRTIWRYRDWVIESLNQNKPFDQFTIEQLAGDLLPNPTSDQILATAFHRNTMTNTEGGTDDEEFRVVAVKDRAITTIQVWMGLTLGCAQCHNHKYDPISQREFYGMFAFFNQTADTDLPSEDPNVPMPTAEMIDENAKTDARIATLRNRIAEPSPELLAEQAEWEKSLTLSSGWTVLNPATMASESGSPLAADYDGTIRVTGGVAANDSYTIEAETNVKDVTALRLEVIPDPNHPAKGSGRHADGNFVLSRFSIEAADPANLGKPLSGRYVRIELPGKNRILSLAEVQVISAGWNVAQGKSASQVSTEHGGEAARAVDGNTNGDYFAANSVTHTKEQKNPWWEVDLGESKPIERIVVWNRTDGGQQSRLKDAVVQILDDKRKEQWSTVIDPAPESSREFPVTGWHTLAIASASADFSQTDFAVADAVDPNNVTKSGWAVGPRVAEPHTASFVFAEPINKAAKIRLRVRLDHRFEQPNYLLGRFRLAVTNDPAALRRATVPSNILALADLPSDTRSDSDRKALADYYRAIAPRLEPLRKEIERLDKSRPQPPAVPVLKELPADKRRKSFVMVKGNFLVPGEEVSPVVPASLPSMPKDSPRNRLGLAEWIMAPDNPLTARVAVNRLWARLFGRGIVETEEDFGTQGTLPTHPNVLDELALDFRERGWDVKAAIRQIVTSSTYCQTSQTTPDRLAKDPANRLLARGPRQRLDAETVRDQALALAGVLSTKMLGPSVYPYQPDGLWRAAFNGSDRTWSTSSGEDRFRRGLYTFWRRTIPYPSMAAFDAPSREICTLRRTSSNTPLQAFVTLNDPVYVEASQALARRMIREGGSTPEERVHFGLELCLGRPPEQDSVRALVNLYQSELKGFWSDKDRATAMATDPLGPLPAGMDLAEAAAWTVVANVLLNLDGVLTK